MIFCILFLTTSCVAKQPDTSDILASIIKESKNLPEGILYLSGSLEGEETYLSNSTIASLYSKEAIEDAFEAIRSYSIYLSEHYFPFEVAVFDCYSETEANRVYLMCQDRINDLSVLFMDTEFREFSEYCKVIKSRNIVVMIISEDIEKLESKARVII